MVEKLQQRNIGVHATIDGINDELVLFVMQNVRVFPMHGVSKIPEWSIIRVRWANRTLGQYTGDWSCCEGYFSPFLRDRGCKGLSQRCAATRGCGGTAAHSYTRGRIFSFLEQTVDVNEYFIDVKHCLNTVKSVDAIKNGPQYRCSWYWERMPLVAVQIAWSEGFNSEKPVVLVMFGCPLCGTFRPHIKFIEIQCFYSLLLYSY